MIEKAETEFKELIHKKKVVENDKKKIEDVIDELDHKKNQALQVRYEYGYAFLWSVYGMCPLRYHSVILYDGAKTPRLLITPKNAVCFPVTPGTLGGRLGVGHRRPMRAVATQL